ncbi:MAG: zinc-binding dehydrogenase [Actinomycetota bacterium]
MSQPAVVNFAPEPLSVELRRIGIPEIGPEDVLLEVAAVGVCGSDIHQWQGRQSWPVNYPVVLGHEFAGIVQKVGERVAAWAPGDRVVSETAAIVDLDSPMTRRGLYNLDPARRGFGAAADGGMTKYVRVPARCLHRVPDRVPWEKAALTEPCCVAYNAVVANSPVAPGDRVVVLGPGAVGLLCAAVARLRGAEVGVVGLQQDRLRLNTAQAYGCTAILGDALEWARATDGLGADVVIDAAGVSASLETALRLARPAGWITKVGWGGQPLGCSLDPLVQKNLTLRGSFSHNWPVWERTIELIASGRLDLGPIIGGIWPLEHWQQAFQQMDDRAVVKAVLKP